MSGAHPDLGERGQADEGEHAGRPNLTWPDLSPAPLYMMICVSVCLCVCPFLSFGPSVRPSGGAGQVFLGRPAAGGSARRAAAPQEESAGRPVRGAAGGRRADHHHRHHARRQTRHHHHHLLLRKDSCSCQVWGRGEAYRRRRAGLPLGTVHLMCVLCCVVLCVSGLAVHRRRRRRRRSCWPDRARRSSGCSGCARTRPSRSTRRTRR